MRNALLLCLTAGIGIATGQVMKTITVGAAPLDLIEAVPHRRLYVACQGSDSVYAIDMTDDSVVGVLAVPDRPVCLGWNRAGSKLYVGCLDTLGTRGSVAVVDVPGDSVVTTIPVGGRPCRLAWSPAQDKVYCLNSEGRSLSVIDGAGDTLLATIPLGIQPSDLVYIPRDDVICVSCSAPPDSGLVYFIDCATDSILGTVTAGLQPWAMAHDSVHNRLHVVDVTGGMLYVVDCESRVRLGAVPTLEQPSAVCVTPLPHNKVWVGCGWGHAIQWMFAHNLAWDGTIDVGDEHNPCGFCYLGVLQTLFCASELAASVLVLEPRVPRVSGTFRVGEGPRPMVSSSFSAYVYLGNTWDNTVMVMTRLGGGSPEAPGPGALTDARIRPTLVRAGPVRLADDGEVEVFDPMGRRVENDRFLSPGAYLVRSGTHHKDTEVTKILVTR